MDKKTAVSEIAECVEIFVRGAAGVLLANVVLDGERHLLKPTTIEGALQIRDMLQRQLNTVDSDIESMTIFRDRRERAASGGVELESPVTTFGEWKDEGEIYMVGRVDRALPSGKIG
jgi:hypothetical protein